MAVHDVAVTTIDGESISLGEFRGKAMLIVNTASQCGLTPQFAGLQSLYDRYADKGLVVLGFPCNQFGNQEPGTEGEIKSFCESGFGVTFPMFAKLEVNGDARHPLYTELTSVPDEDGKSGDVVWNFEKFLVTPDGEIAGRFRPLVTPEDDRLVRAIEDVLPG